MGDGDSMVVPGWNETQKRKSNEPLDNENK